MIGIEERDTKTGIHVFRIHYTADPMKRVDTWQDDAAKGMPGGKQGKAWRREMDIDWTVASGFPVYEDEFSRDLHIAKESLLALPGKVILRGWDFGLTPACCWAQNDSLSRLNVLGELVAWDGRGPMKQMGIERFAPMVIAQSNEWFPGARFIDYADPAGWQKAQTDEKSCIQIMQALGIEDIRRGPVTWTDRKARMVNTLGQVVGGRGKLMIDPSCTMLIEGFCGAYKFEEIADTGRHKESVEKNAWSHIMNGLEYLVGAIYADPIKEETNIPTRRKPSGRAGY
jgi:hypothetical protein